MRKCVVAAATTLLIGLSTAPVRAQDAPAYDASGGYSFLRDSETNFHGWLASASGAFNDWFGVTAEVGGNYATRQVLGTDINLSVHGFFVGPRFWLGGTPAVRPFLQVLLGGTQASAAVLGESASITKFSVQPGAGVDFWVRRPLGIRVGVDGRRIYLGDDAGDSDSSVQFRFYAGLVLGGGRR